MGRERVDDLMNLMIVVNNPLPVDRSQTCTAVQGDRVSHPTDAVMTRISQIVGSVMKWWRSSHPPGFEQGEHAKKCPKEPKQFPGMPSIPQHLHALHLWHLGLLSKTPPIRIIRHQNPFTDLSPKAPKSRFHLTISTRYPRPLQQTQGTKSTYTCASLCLETATRVMQECKKTIYP